MSECRAAPREGRPGGSPVGVLAGEPDGCLDARRSATRRPLGGNGKGAPLLHTTPATEIAPAPVPPPLRRRLAQGLHPRPRRRTSPRAGAAFAHAEPLAAPCDGRGGA